MKAIWVLACLAACASAPSTFEVGPVTGRAVVGARTFECARAGLFETTGGTKRWLGDCGLRPFALAGGAVGLLVGGGSPAVCGEVRLCDLDGHVLAGAQIAADLVYGVAINPIGKLAAAACADGSVQLLTLPQLTEPRVAWRHGAAAVAVAFSPDRELLASAGLDGVVVVGNLAASVEPQRLVDHTAGVLCLAWSADGQCLASGARDGKVRLHARSGRLLRTWPRLGGEVLEVEFAGREVVARVARLPGMANEESIVLR
jgi:hypothetical protein